MTSPTSGSLAPRVRALLANLGDEDTTHLQRHQLWTTVLNLLYAAGFAVPGGPPRPRRGRNRRHRRRQAYAYQQRAEPEITQLSVGERIH